MRIVKRGLIACAAAALALAPARVPAEPSARPPNIVFILADDLGYMDIGANNAKTFYETPNIDRLAATGMRFTQGYAACPVCSPTRASIMTGKYPPRMHITNFIAGDLARRGLQQFLRRQVAPRHRRILAECPRLWPGSGRGRTVLLSQVWRAAAQS